MVIGSGMKAGALQGKGRNGLGADMGADMGMNPGERLMNPAENAGVTQDLSENVIFNDG